MIDVVKLALALVTATLSAACLRTPAYHCDSAAQCEAGGVAGRCEASGYCSVPDPSCGSGYRWASGAPDSGCVGAGGPDGGPGSTFDLCWPQPARARGVDACVDSVCAKDARCCDREWSDQCVNLAETTCGHACGAVVGSIGYGTIRVQQWDGTRLAPVWTKTTFANTGTSAIAWADFDGDHKPDLATCESGSQTLPGKICVWTNGGSCGEAFCQVKCVDSADCYQVSWVDIDHDGDLDVAMMGAYQSALWLNDQGLFGNTLRMPFGAANVAGAAWADVDGDGQIDIAQAGYDSKAIVSRITSGGPDAVTLTPIWDDSATDATSRHEDVAFGDVDLDGRVDLVVSGQGLLKVWKNATPEADGFMTGTTPSYTDPTYDAASIALLDVDEDGDLDLVVADDGGHVDVLRNNAANGASTITMTPFWVSGASFNVAEVVARDVDGDHHVDLVVGSDEVSASTSLSIYLARGALGQFGHQDGSPSYEDPSAMHVTGLALTGAW